jgi:hypothetical protein
MIVSLFQHLLVVWYESLAAAADQTKSNDEVRADPTENRIVAERQEGKFVRQRD